jgi:hypothetical protein
VPLRPRNQDRNQGQQDLNFLWGCGWNCLSATAILYWASTGGIGGGKFVVATQVKDRDGVFDGTYSNMHAMIESLGDDLTPYGWSSGVMSVQGAGEWYQEWPHSVRCAEGATNMTLRIVAWGTNDQGEVTTEYRRDRNDQRCPRSSGGNGEANEVQLDAATMLDEFLCEEYDLGEGIWHVFVDGEYMGVIEC